MPSSAAPEERQRAWLCTLRDVFVVMRVLRAPILCAILVAVILVVPAQTHEVIRAQVQYAMLFDWPWATRVELAAAAITLVGLVAALWWVARVCLAQRSGRPATASVQTWAVRLIVVTPLAATALALLGAVTDLPSPEGQQAIKHELAVIYPALQGEGPVETLAREEALANLLGYNQVLAWAALAVALAAGAIAFWMRVPAADRLRAAAPGLALFGRTGTALVLAGVAAVFAASIVLPAGAVQGIGVFAVTFAFVACLLAVLAQLSHIADETGIPVIAILLVVAVLLSLADLNDNHEIYRETVNQRAAASGPSAPPALEAAFHDWYKARQKPGRLPVYVVAAQGGGAYAALHAAAVLGNLQETCPAFARHLFAISGVSGGSVGAATFASLLHHTEQDAIAAAIARPCARPKRSEFASLSALADNALSADLLSPLVAALLFPEMLQRFLPVPVPAFDRSQRLEAALELAVAATLERAPGRTQGQQAATGFLAARYRDHWRADGNIPALIFNTTEVGSGRRRVIAPFAFAAPSLLAMPLWEKFVDHPRAGRIGEMSVSTAAFLSARFPWVTPAGTFYDWQRNDAGEVQRGKPPRRYRAVDGGYFENSGVATAVDLIQDMTAAARKHGFADRIEIRLVILTNASYPEQTFYGLSEALSPILALLSTRQARASATIADAGTLLEGAVPVRRHLIRLRDEGYEMPLGWRLAPVSTILIRTQAGRPGRCVAGRGRHGEGDADCLLDDVVRDLTP